MGGVQPGHFARDGWSALQGGGAVVQKAEERAEGSFVLSDRERFARLHRSAALCLPGSAGTVPGAPGRARRSGSPPDSVKGD